MEANHRRSIARVLFVSLTGCAGLHKLAGDYQLALASRPKIHAVHHSSRAAFTVTTVRPDGTRLEPKAQLLDPAPRVKSAESISWAYLPKPPTGVPVEARKAPPMVKGDRQEPGRQA